MNIRYAMVFGLLLLGSIALYFRLSGDIRSSEPQHEETDGLAQQIEEERQPVVDRRGLQGDIAVNLDDSEGSVGDSEVVGLDFAAANTWDDFLIDAASRHGWSDSSLHSNSMIWSKPCGRFETLRGRARDDERLFQMLREFDPTLTFVADFAQFCEGLADSDGFVSPSASEALAQFSSGQILSEYEDWAALELASAAGNRDLVREIAVSNLDLALRHFDEAGARGAIFKLIHPSPPQLRVPAEFGADSTRLGGLLIPSASLVATELICREIGGCRGSDHPMVLRTCMMSFERTIGCLQPVDFIDAVYQTHTPLEFALFTSTLDQVSAMLASHRRAHRGR